MNRVVSFVSAFLALLAAVAMAQGIENARADCKQQRDRDRTIAGCTVIILPRSDVLRATGGEQRPGTSDSLDGEVVLKPLN